MVTGTALYKFLTECLCKGYGFETQRDRKLSSWWLILDFSLSRFPTYLSLTHLRKHTVFCILKGLVPQTRSNDGCNLTSFYIRLQIIQLIQPYLFGIYLYRISPWLYYFFFQPAGLLIQAVINKSAVLNKKWCTRVYYFVNMIIITIFCWQKRVCCYKRNHW